MENATDIPSMEILTFDLEGEAFAVKADHVREILDLIPVTEVPGAPAFVNGLINVRGKVVPVVDPRLRLGLEAGAHTVDTRIIVIETDDGVQGEIVGILADKVNEVAAISTERIEASPTIGVKWDPAFVLGIGKRAGDGFIHILDLPTLVQSGI